MLGVGGVVEELRRTSIDTISVDEAIRLCKLPDYEEFELGSYGHNKLINMTNIDIDITNIDTIKNGGFLQSSMFLHQEECYLVTIENRVVALYERYNDKYYKPRNVLI